MPHSQSANVFSIMLWTAIHQSSVLYSIHEQNAMLTTSKDAYDRYAHTMYKAYTQYP